MNQKIQNLTLQELRNDLKLVNVIHGLNIPWRIDDQKMRFRCPRCGCLDTSVHPNVNLGRCFSCKLNYNTIDLVMASRKVQFRTAVDWLLSLKNILKSGDGQTLLLMQARRSRLS